MKTKAVVLLIFIIAQAQSLDSDSTLHKEENAIVYERSKIVIRDGGHTFETYDDEFKTIVIPWLENPGITIGGCFLISYHFWNAFQADSMLTEEELFTITGHLDKANVVRGYQSNLKIMKWSSPFLIVGGVLLSGFSSEWGKNSDHALPIVGLGASLVGAVFGVEAIAKSNRNKFEINEAKFAVNSYNKSLRMKLGLIGTTTSDTNKIETTIDTSGIEVIPLDMLDDTPQRLNFPYFGRMRLSDDSLLHTVVDALIDTSGSVMACEISATSGFHNLDSRVLMVVERMKFTPPKQHRKSVYTIIQIPLTLATIPHRFFTID